MLSPQALVRGLVARALPVFNADNQNTDVALRQWPYGELATQPLIRKAHALADEGSYFVTNNAQAGIAPTYGTAFSATAPFIVIQNIGSLRCYLDYIALVAIAAGASTTTAGYIAAAVVVDNILRYTSGGTALAAAVNPNMLSPNNVGINAYCGAITAAAASGAARTICGVRNLRPSVSATVINVVGDMNLLNFGGVEGGAGSITIANANIMPQTFPPVIIGPQQSALIYLWFPVMTAPSAATFAPEIGFFVR